jgi:hypothetical protein
MIKPFLIIALLLLSIAVIAENSKQYTGKYQVSETLIIYGAQDSTIGEYAMEITQINDSIFELININNCADTIEALLQRDTLFIVNQTAEYSIDQKVHFDGYGCMNNQSLMFWIKQFDFRDYSNSVLTCIDEEEYKRNSFISHSKVWAIAIKDASLDKWQYSANYWYNGFTILNGTTYFYLYESSFKNNHLNGRYISLWRESDHRIYKRSLTGNEELVFNTSLEPNDTLYFNENNYCVIDSVVEKEWGEKLHKHWYMTSIRGEKSSWIEDVGNAESISGYNLEISDTISELLCFEENGEIVYQNNEYNYCIVLSTSSLVIESKKSLIDLFSVDYGLLQLQSKNNISGEIMLYTSDGKQVLKEPIYGTERTICIPSSGLLLYRFVTEKGEVQTGKVVVR